MNWQMVLANAGGISAIAAALAAIGSLATVMIAFRAMQRQQKTALQTMQVQRDLQKSQLKHEALRSNVSLLVDVWSRLGNEENLLRFHGITPKQLQDAGINVKELAYLLASFEAAAYYYEDIDSSGDTFPSGSLRDQMCASEDIQQAWSGILKPFLREAHSTCKK